VNGPEASAVRPRPSRLRPIDLLVYLILSLAALTVLVPLFWMAMASLKKLTEVYQFSWLPRVPQWRNYMDGLEVMGFSRYFLNSSIITVLNVVGESAVAAMAGFAFARLDFPGKKALFALALSTMMLPFAAIMIPSFVLFRMLGWIDTYTVMTVPSILAAPAFHIFLMRQFFLTIPRELDEAAKMDACGWYRIFWSILLPLSRPALTTVAIYAFMGHWGELMRAVLFLNSATMRTVPMGLALLNMQREEPTLALHLMMSNSVLYTLPPIVLYLVFQKYFTRLGSELRGISVK
jgi:ABC-type glycerol-3-phosphate transport system permease component